MLDRRFCTITCIALIVGIVFAACEHVKRDQSDTRTQPASSMSPTSTEKPSPAQRTGKSFVYNFDNLQTGALPTTFSSARTGEGPIGQWEVKADESAPSRPNVLAQVSADSTDYRFPLAVLNEGVFKDLEVSVKFKAISGSVDQAGGLVFRYRDENNYYVVRANALENNYRLYHVVNGRRQQFAGANLTVTPKQWHELKVLCVGNQITCFFDGQQEIQATDDTFKEAGKVGVWTKADSVTYFDDLSVTAR